MKSESTDKLSQKQKKFRMIYKQNLFDLQKLEKKLHNKRNEPKNYASSKKVELNSKYIKKTRIKNYKNKFFQLFC